MEENASYDPLDCNEESNHVTIKHELDRNPWDVDNLDVFCAYHCPECPYQDQNKNEFQNHAVSNHELVSFHILLRLFMFYYFNEFFNHLLTGKAILARQGAKSGIEPGTKTTNHFGQKTSDFTKLASVSK